MRVPSSMAEQRPFKPRVLGSSPRGLTKRVGVLRGAVLPVGRAARGFCACGSAADGMERGAAAKDQPQT